MATTTTRTHPALIYTLLGLILWAGLTLRTWNVQWDDGINSHPDERWVTCSIAPSISWPQSWEEFRDPRRSPLNPLWNRQEQRTTGFTYGHFPLYLGILTGEALHRLAPIADALPVSDRVVGFMDRANAPCAGVAVAGRLLIALLDTLTIFFLFWLGRRVYGTGAGLLAAAFYAFTAQAIQLSHFFAMDPASTTFTVLAVLGGVMMVQARSWRAVILTGVAAGLAISSKFSALPILAVPVMAAAVVFWRERGADQPADGRAALRLLIGVPLALLLAFVAFFVTSPYAVLDWENFSQAVLVEQGAMVRGIADFPYTRQYRNTTPYLYFIQQQVQWGLWWPLGIAALLGTAWAVAKIVVARARPEELVVWAWVVPYFGLTGAFLAKFNRYMSPVLPFVLLFAAGMIWTLWTVSTQRQRETQRRREAEAQREQVTGEQSSIVSRQSSIAVRNWLSRTLAIFLAILALGGGIFWSLAYVNGVYNTEHTWIIASRWIYENAPAGSAILWEVWDDPLPKSLPEPGMDMGSAGLRNVDWSPYEEDTAEKYEILKQKLREADYVVYSSKRIYDSVDELPERYPMTNRYYELMFAEQLGFRHAADVTTPPRLFGIEFPDQAADESWSLYDHPRVSIFAKERNLTDAEFDALLGGTWENAIPWYTGEPSPLDPLLNLLGLGSAPASRDRGLIGGVVALLTGQESSAPAPAPDAHADLTLDRPLNELPIVDDYRWNVAASENPWLATGWWWLVLSLLGWIAWPIAFVLFRSLRDRGYLLSKALGWLLAGWLLWIFASFELAHNTVINAWLSVALLAVIGGFALVWRWRAIGRFLRRSWPLLLVGEGIFAVAYVAFILIRMGNPDLWQPWLGGEKFMEFAFLNGILRSPTFPPVDPHFAGGFINYYYFGIYLVAYLIKLTGIYAEVAFNLSIAALFALTVVNAFGVAYSALGWEATRRVQRAPGDEAMRRRGGVGQRSLRQEREVAQPEGAVFERGDETWDFSDYRNWGRFPSGNGRQIGSVSARAYRTVETETGRDVLEIEVFVEPEPVPQRESATPSARAVDLSSGVTVAQTPEPGSGVEGELDSHLHWSDGLGGALLAPLFVAVIGNLDAFAQVVRNLAAVSTSEFQSAIPLVQTMVRAVNGLWLVLTTEAQLPAYDFWAPSRVIPSTINEFPYWSFTFADLHPHMIGIPFSVLFLGLVLALLHSHDTDWTVSWRRGLVLLLGFSLLLGTLASINLWELPTYYGLGVLALAVTFFRGRGRIPWLLFGGVAVAYGAGAYLFFWPFFRTYTNVGASGVGLVRGPDDPGEWLLIWGFFFFVLASWVIWEAARPARRGDARPTGLERWLGLAWGWVDRLPRLLHLHELLVRHPTPAYLLGRLLVPLLIAVAVVLAWLDWWVLALCLPFVGLSFLLIWRRGRHADPGGLFAALLATTGFALLAGTQVFYLKDFLSGGDWYRMNTLFKFFIQIWVLWGVAAAIAVARILAGSREQGAGGRWQTAGDTQHSALQSIWIGVVSLLLVASLAYPLWGTPARLDQRFPGWRPEYGTLNALEFMRQGAYFWPDGDNAIELRYDWQAIQWLLDNVRGNVVIAESATLEYYRAGGTRVASMTGLSGLSGMHESEQRYGDQVSQRNALLGEFWSTQDVGRTQQLIEELAIDLIYVGQLERHEHPAAVDKLARMAAEGLLIPFYENERVTIYAVPGQLVQTADGHYVPNAERGQRSPA